MNRAVPEQTCDNEPDGWGWIEMLLNSDHSMVFELLNNRDTPNLYLAASGGRLYFGTRRSGLSPLSEAGLERVDIAEYLECCRVRVYEDMTKLLVNHPDELVAN